MESDGKNKFEKGESLDDEIPPWAMSLFNKMKAEICAETHARIAYTMRLMLDEVKDEIKVALNSGKPCLRPGVLQQNDECTCKELQHVAKCLKKCGGRRHREETSTGKFQPLAAICHAQRKEEKKQAKSEYKAARKERKKAKTRVKSSSTEGETEEFDPVIEKTQSNKTSYQFGPLQHHPDNVKLVSITQILSPPLTPRKISVPFHKVEREVLEPKTTEPGKEDAKEHQLEVKGCGQNDAIQPQSTDIELPGKISSSMKNPDILNLGPDVLPSLSDSEFEVVSLPPNIKPVADYPQQAEEESPFLSDYYDEEGSIGGSDAETELLDDEYEINEKIPTKSELYPVEELKKMSISVSTMSTSSTTVVDDFMSTCSNEDNVLEDAVVGAVALPVERQRNPYSVSSEEVKKINIEEIVNHQPLPPEFHRNRNPYAAGVQDDSENPLLSSQTTTTAEPERASESSERPRDPYRVDVLPESLWEEAMTVAAKGYNAAKMVVGNLGSLVDPFAPVSENVEQRATSSSPNRFAGATGNTSSISTSMSSSAGVAAGLANHRPQNMTRAEQQLYEMGFTNHALNATLLARHKNDLGKVISELLDH